MHCRHDTALGFGHLHVTYMIVIGLWLLRFTLACLKHYIDGTLTAAGMAADVR